jgi:putative MATE family efflux protein
MNKKNSEMLENMNIKKLLITLSIPATLGMMVNALYNLVDAFFVAQGAGQIALGALTLAFPVQIVITAVGIMIGVGSASVFSRAFGRKDYETMKTAVNTALRIDLLIAGVISIFGFLFLDELLVLFAASESNIGYAKDYLGVIMLGLVPLSLTIVMNNLARAEGRPKIAMITMMIGAGMNILLDPFFIFDFGLGLGVRGAALATVVSQSIAFVYALVNALSNKSSLQIDVKNWLKLHTKTAKEILTVGFPTFVRNSIGAILSIVILNLISFYSPGDSAIYTSIYGVINRIMAFIFMPGFGLVMGLAPIAGFSYGAQNYKRLTDSIIFATSLMMGYFALGFVFIQLFSETIFTAFSEEGSNAEFFISYGARSFKIISYGFLLLGLQIMLSSVYQALGYPIKALVVATSRQFWLFLPIALLMTSLFALDGIWMTFAIADILAGLLSFFMLRHELNIFKRKHKEQEQQTLAFQS